jgi:hypothetical protein
MCFIHSAYAHLTKLRLHDSSSFPSGLAVINASPLPSFLKPISRTSDTILLFKEDVSKPEVVIKDVRVESRTEQFNHLRMHLE